MSNSNFFRAIFSIIASFNIFSSPFQFYMNSSPRMSTTIGSFLSLLIFLIIFFVFSTSDMLNHTHPIISDETLSFDQYEITITNENLFPVLKIYEFIREPTKNKVSINYLLNDPTYFQLSATKISSFGTIEEIYDLHLCTSENSDTNSNYSEYFQTGYCFLRKNESISLKSENSWFGSFDSLSLTISLCNNATSNNTCKPLQQILEYTKEKYFVVDFVENKFHLENYASPTTKYFKTYINDRINSNLFIKKIMTLMEIELILDDSFWFGDTTSHKFIQKDFTEDHTEIHSRTAEEFEKDPRLVQYYLFPSLCKRVLKRRYQKITELLSIIGGLASFLHFIGSFISNFFLQRKFLLFLVNKLYRVFEEENNVEDSIKEEIKNEKVNQSIENKGSLNKRNKEDLVEFELNRLDDNKIQEKEERTLSIPVESRPHFRFYFEEIVGKLVKKHPLLRISSLEYVKYAIKKLCCKRKLTEKEKIIEICEEKYKEEIDIYRVLKKIKEIELLKEILFDKNQLIIFNHIQNSYLKGENKSEEEESARLQESAMKLLKQRKNNKTLGELDRKLVTYLEKN